MRRRRTQQISGRFAGSSTAGGYHRRFCALYGHHRLVPLSEVLDPVTGLGPPRAGDGLGAEDEPDPRRTAVLARLLADNLTDRAGELELREEHIDQWPTPPLWTRRAVPRSTSSSSTGRPGCGSPSALGPGRRPRASRPASGTAGSLTSFPVSGRTPAAAR